MGEYLYNKNAEIAKYLERAYVSTAKLSVTSIKEAIILPYSDAVLEGGGNALIIR